MFLKKGMKVKVRVGKDKGKTGEIIEIDRGRYLAKVKEINMLKKHSVLRAFDINISLDLSIN